MRFTPLSFALLLALAQPQATEAQRAGHGTPPPTPSPAALQRDSRSDSQYQTLISNCYEGKKYGLSAEVIRAECLRLRKFPNVDPETQAETHNVIGLLAYDEKRYDDAIREFDEAVKIVPNYRYAMNNKALALLGSKRCTESLKLYEETNLLHPEVGATLYGIGESQKCLKNYPDALKAYTAAVLVSPHLDSYFRARALMYLITGEIEKSFEDFEAAARLNPTDPTYPLNAAQAAIMLNDIESAGKYLAKYAKLSESDVYSLAWIYLMNLRQSNAEKEKQATTDALGAIAAKENWNGALARFLLGSLSEDELCEKARSMTKDELHGYLLDCYYFAAEMALVRGDKTRARERFQKAAELNALTYLAHFHALGRLRQLKGS